ncbi:aminotransferase class I/II-fold pyridoxal phosphate-dependent enzyme [Ferruginivarius sediminum]|uniref:Aminotransferase n=2 Tax=Ferruginivarius sediminum TaxID=2661937 RepID=A0A369T7S3_9PROT|nr:aminotransferase class I/II-fold pyridoxal phosphate-dependent enzyme [Ferruginivarius sediminum]
MPQSPLPLRPEAETLEASKIVEVWELGFGRDDLIPLWVGEGDLPTPDFICEAATRALKDGKTFYTHKRGLPELRAAIADYTHRLYGARLSDERISVTSAGMNAIQLIMQAIVRSGDEVLALTPVWPNALAAARVNGANVVEVPLRATAEGDFRLDMDVLEAACGNRTRAMFIASPSNPTGWMLEREEQQAILELCRRRGIWLIADEVYHRFVYDRPTAPSFQELIAPEDPVFVVNSFSKAWAMTGWRLGWLVHPPSLRPVIDNLIEFNTSGAPPFLQEGALTAIRDGERFVHEMVERCRHGADVVHQRLAAMPRVTMACPRASFYAFFAVEGVADSLGFAKQILRETGVGLAPGAAFGRGGEGFLRLCFASSTERLSAAMDRLEPALS